VDLGVEAKFVNVQKTEELRLAREYPREAAKAAAAKPVVRPAPKVQVSLPSSQDGYLNYGRARFLTSSVTDKRAMGSSKGVVDVPGQELDNHTEAFEIAKKRAFDRGACSTPTHVLWRFPFLAPSFCSTLHSSPRSLSLLVRTRH
jgi:hypothetical protein